MRQELVLVLSPSSYRNMIHPTSARIFSGGWYQLINSLWHSNLVTMNFETRYQHHWRCRPKLKWYYDQKIISFFSLDFESVFAKHPTGKILSFAFYPKAVYLECKFWISRYAITHVACSAGGFRRDERMYIPIGCSGCHLELEKQWRVGARQKVYQASGREKENWGRGRGRPTQSSPSLQQIQNGGLTLERWKPLEPPALLAITHA